MAYVKTILFVLLGCVLGVIAIYIVNKSIDTVFTSSYKEVGGLSPLFSALEYLFTGLVGIVLGGATFALLTRRQLFSKAFLCICAACSIGIIVFGMPLTDLFTHSQQIVLPFNAEFTVAKRLLGALYWVAPLVWSLTLTACIAFQLKLRTASNKIVA